MTPMRALIAEAIHVVVYMKEFGRLGRQVTEIIVITGYGEEGYRYEHIYRISGGRKHG